MNWWMYLLDVSGGCNWWMWFTSSCDWIEAFFCQKLWHSTVFFHQRYCWSKNSNTLDFRCFSKNRVGFDIFLAHDFPCFFKYIYHVYILFNINIFSYSYILQTCNTYIIYKHVYMDIYIYINLFLFCDLIGSTIFCPKKHGIPAVWNVASSASARNQSPELRFCSKLGWWNHVSNEKTLVG